MPRISRERSESGIYHIMLRGANRQEIFHDEEDCVRLLETLERYKKKSEMKVYGWCFMGNHVHLLLHEGNEDFAVTMKRIGVSYAWFYNWKYKTTGHLFQDRYRSEKVENNEYLIAVARYIHQNPVKAGIVERPNDWKWSSCRGYYNNACYQPGLLDSELILDIFSKDRKTAVSKFIEFNETISKDNFIDDTVKLRFSDEEAMIEINKVIVEHGIAAIKSLPKIQRDEVVRRIKEIDGLTQRQLSRILGIPLSLINRA